MRNRLYGRQRWPLGRREIGRARVGLLLGSVLLLLRRRRRTWRRLGRCLLRMLGPGVVGKMLLRVVLLRLLWGVLARRRRRRRVGLLRLLVVLVMLVMVVVLARVIGGRGRSSSSSVGGELVVGRSPGVHLGRAVARPCGQGAATMSSAVVARGSDLVHQGLWTDWAAATGPYWIGPNSQ